MTRLLKTAISAGTLGIFALVLSGVLFCAVTPAGMPGMNGMDAGQCPAALALHFDTVQILTGASVSFNLLLELVALAGAAMLVVFSIFQTTIRLSRPSRAPLSPHWLLELFRRGILHPKIFPLS